MTLGVTTGPAQVDLAVAEDKQPKPRFQLSFSVQEIDNGFLITTNRNYDHHSVLVNMEPPPMKFIPTLKDLEKEVILMVTKEKMGFNNG